MFYHDSFKTCYDQELPLINFNTHVLYIHINHISWVNLNLNKSDIILEYVSTFITVSFKD